MLKADSLEVRDVLAVPYASHTETQVRSRTIHHDADAEDLAATRKTGEAPLQRLLHNRVDRAAGHQFSGLRGDHQLSLNPVSASGRINNPGMEKEERWKRHAIGGAAYIELEPDVPNVAEQRGVR